MKKKGILLIYCLLIPTGFIFSQSSDRPFNNIEESEVIVSEADKNYEEYLILLEKHQLVQNELIDSSNYFKKLRNESYVLSGGDIKIINQSFSKRIELLNQSVTFPKMAIESTINSHFYNLIATHLKIKSLETYMIQQEIVGQNAKVINLINEENQLYRQEKKSLKKIRKIIVSKRFRKTILETWKNSKETSEDYLNKKKNNNIASAILATSYYQNFLSSDKNIKRSRKYFRKLIEEKTSFSADVNFNNFLNKIASGASNLVGNFIGMFSMRKGKLINNEEFINSSLSVLQPLDVILEKTPFRLTDKFIPGYWGHAAIYVGNETQLKELGIWDNPFVAKYHKEIRKKHVIIEALRSKVKFNTFKNFTNIDDYAHLRLIKEPTLEKKREMIVRVFAQIGKKYDFGYDVESSQKIICSELHYITFDEVTFKTAKIMGINTISVDQVAEQGLKGGAFYPIDLYLDGIRIEEDQIFEIYDQLPTARNREIKKLKQRLHL